MVKVIKLRGDAGTSACDRDRLVLSAGVAVTVAVSSACAYGLAGF
ncbi:hypothetical protein [Actinoallomurus sp. NPDC050550]